MSVIHSVFLKPSTDPLDTYHGFQVNTLWSGGTKYVIISVPETSEVLAIYPQNNKKL